MKIRHQNSDSMARSHFGKFNAVVSHAALSGYRYTRISHGSESVILETERRSLGSNEYILISSSWLSKVEDEEDIPVDKTTWFWFYCFKLMHDCPTKLGLIGFLIVLSGLAVDATLGLSEKEVIELSSASKIISTLIILSWVAKLGGVILLFVKDIVSKKT